MKQIYKTKEEKAKMDQKIQEMKSAFYNEFGCEVIIVLREPVNYHFRMSLENLQECIDAVVDKSYPGMFPNGIWTKSRHQVLVNYRYCFFKLARKMRYTTTRISQFSGFHHATIIHGVKEIDNYVSISEEQTVINLNLIYNELKERYGIDGDIHLNGEESDFS